MPGIYVYLGVSKNLGIIYLVCLGKYMYIFLMIWQRIFQRKPYYIPFSV